MYSQLKSKETDIKFSDIEVQSATNHEQYTYELDDGSTITHYIHFPNTMLIEMFQDIQSILPKDDTEISEYILQNFVLFHTIKKFTHLGDQLKATDFSGQLQEMEALIDTEFDGKSLFTLIIDEVFQPQEIKKVFDMLFDSLANTAMVKRLTEQSLLQLQELNIENKEILQNLNTDSVN